MINTPLLATYVSMYQTTSSAISMLLTNLAGLVSWIFNACFHESWSNWENLWVNLYWKKNYVFAMLLRFGKFRVLTFLHFIKCAFSTVSYWIFLQTEIKLKVIILSFHYRSSLLLYHYQNWFGLLQSKPKEVGKNLQVHFIWVPGSESFWSIEIYSYKKVSGGRESLWRII